MTTGTKTESRAWVAALRGGALAVALALAACGGSEGSSGGTDGGMVAPGTAGSKCPMGTECIAGVQCVAGECSTGANGETCDNRIISCDPGLTCVDSRCKPQ